MICFPAYYVNFTSGEKKHKLSGLLRINLILSALLQGFPIYMLVMPTLPTHTQTHQLRNNTFIEQTLSFSTPRLVSWTFQYH